MKTTAQMVALARQWEREDGILPDELASRISDWLQEWRPPGERDRIYEAGEFIHEQLVWGVNSALDIALGLKDYFNVRKRNQAGRPEFIQAHHSPDRSGDPPDQSAETDARRGMGALKRRAPLGGKAFC